MQRSALRPIYTTPPLRPPETPSGPSHREIWRRWEELEWWSCVYCDVSLGGMVVAEVDHVIPLSSGGRHELANLAPACRECNRSKSARSVGDWLAIRAGQSATPGMASVAECNERSQSPTANITSW
ncbi:HNH endonuclease [Streptomyces sp. NBC_01267]|uniref:HNH endonuclease n=1 Tax=Streptomyces sp. NBC_01267 TaxID=2903805 RepID=UPI003FCE5CFF